MLTPVPSLMPIPSKNCTRKHTTGATCDAFPGGIPNEILHNDVSHRLPFPGDGGLVFDQYEAPAE